MPKHHKLKVTVVGGKTVEVNKGITLAELAEDFAYVCQYPILVAAVNNELYELHRKIIDDCTIEFLDITTPNGFRVYQRTASFIMLCAARDELGADGRIVIEHSISKNYYCEFSDENVKVTRKILAAIEDRMRMLVSRNLPIEKLSLPLDEGIKICEEMGADDKIQMLQYRRTSHVNFYKLDGFYDYFYGQMAASTGAVSLFQLSKESRGFLLQFPAAQNPREIAEKKVLSKITNVFSESNRWARILKADTVGSLNSIICGGHHGDFIRTNEALHEKKIAAIADMIHNQKKKIVLIAGPSSSGKTTFAHRLCIQLRVNGLRPHVISLDNYFVNREQTPLDEFGQPNYEDLYAIDVQTVNGDLSKLLQGETVEVPTFNFITGCREYKGNYLRLDEGDILVLEGIHGLNEKLTEHVPKEAKFKIFISALTQLNIDNHNRIPTSDTRLIRRIVRDNQYRGVNAMATLNMWGSVGRGEDRYIFPFQEEADAMFNSALVYEMCVLKQFAEPLLFQVNKSMPQYTEARRLVKFLDSFIGISSEEVPRNSILREFIGGSCFKT